MKKKVLISAFACNPTQGTEPGYGWNFSIEMSKHFSVHCLVRLIDKQDIEFAMSQPSNNKSDITFHFVKVPNVLEKLWSLSGIWVYMYYLTWQFYAFTYAKKLILIDKINIDFVHHITWGSLQLGTFLYKLNKYLIIGPVGGGQITPKELYQYLGNGIYLEYLRNIVSFLMVRINPACYNSIKHAKFILCSNQETLDLTIKIRKKNNKGVYLFPDTIIPLWLVEIAGKNKKEFNVNETKILWIGRFLSRKGLELAIEVISTLKHLPISVVFVGDGSKFNEIQLLAKNKGIDHIVSFKGNVPHRDVADYYMKTDVLLFTSYRESGGVQLMEALALGVPIVCLDIHGAKNIVPKEASIKVDLSNNVVLNFSRAIEEFHNLSIEKKYKMSDFAKSFANNQSWRKKTEEIINICYDNSSNTQ